MTDTEFYEKARKEIIDAVNKLRQRGVEVGYPSYIEITRVK